MAAYEGDGIVLDNYDARGRVRRKKSPTLMTGQGTGVAAMTDAGLSIRTLTPLECWRLQGFDDEDYRRAVDAGVSQNQLYKQAGNSIAVPVVEHIFRAMFIDKTWIRSPSLRSYLGNPPEKHPKNP